MKKFVKITICVILILCILGAGVFGMVTGTFSKGNLPKYLPSNAVLNEESVLKGKKILFLGSSVTYGYASLGNSFVEFLEKADGVIAYKEAVSGTTLVDRDNKSYVSRLKKVDTNLNLNAFVCQLSTNDATKKLPLGEISKSRDINDFDTSTIIGAMEYIIAYVNREFGCPVVFYTGTKYDSTEYEAMVDALIALKEKWDITVIDMWNSEKLNSVSESDYSLYMADSIHPTMAGYGLWWLPVFETELSEIFKSEFDKS